MSQSYLELSGLSQLKIVLKYQYGTNKKFEFRFRTVTQLLLLSTALEYPHASLSPQACQRGATCREPRMAGKKSSFAPGSARLARLVALGPVGSIDLPSANSGGGDGGSDKCPRDACESGPRPNLRAHILIQCILARTRDPCTRAVHRVCV